MSESTEHIYINDHLALMKGELELLARTQRSNSDTRLGETLDRWELEVEQQFKRLERFLKSTGGSTSPLKQAAAWLTEKVGRMKPNDGVKQYTDLARVVELETLMGLAFARETMWRVLRNIRLDEDKLSSDSCGDMEAQAGEQLRTLQEFHQHAVMSAMDAKAQPSHDSQA